MSNSHIVVGAVLALACIAHLRTPRFPNVLAFSAVGSAILFYFLTGGMKS